MDFVQIEHVETDPQKAVSRLGAALRDSGFGQVVRFSVEEGDGERGTLVVGYAAELAPRAVTVAPDAPLLLVTSILLRPSGEGTHISILDPQVLSVVPDEGDLQAVVEDVRARALGALEQVRAGDATSEGEEDDEGAANRMSQVEQRLYGRLLEAIDNLAENDLSKTPDQLLVLAKAYAVVASLRTAEEIELHLA